MTPSWYRVHYVRTFQLTSSWLLQMPWGPMGGSSSVNMLNRLWLWLRLTRRNASLAWQPLHKLDSREVWRKTTCLFVLYTALSSTEADREINKETNMLLMAVTSFKHGLFIIMWNAYCAISSLPRVRGFWYGFVGVCSLTYCNGNFRFTRVSELLIVIL